MYRTQYIAPCPAVSPACPGHCLPNIDFVKAILIFLDVDVDGEMGVNVSHLVLETLRDADNLVVDDGLDCAERGHTLTRTMV